ncbi:hypothetical protein ZPR_1952 [Zunongwangia profunda SM-A87]|uniref:Uncharacterized protein n=1 Tax=Zunongwangia profunda (strain DSM 18752 / CCTCC AB 206139 / SM-A87) TaxID=655815 RepID=D5B9X9_ZUNPS|nr:hypothetical protein ZPR_1952 [Zunongwangia profunda SM-A87]|tara:strand:+ start:15999 stop:16103 length:105 start_codon:yes stop_codon:yes gene_type:complete
MSTIEKITLIVAIVDVLAVVIFYILLKRSKNKNS